MNKKILSLFCAAAVFAGVLSACGNESGDDSSKPKRVPVGTEKIELTEMPETTAEPTDEPVVTDDETTADESFITPAMWRVTGKNGAVVTMTGSMHALSQDDYPLPKEMTEAFDNSEILAVEADVSTGDDITYQSALLASMYYDDPDDKLSGHISKEAYEALGEYAKTFDLDISQYENVKPWAVSSMFDSLPLQYTDLSSDLGLDSHLMDEARAEGKEIYEVEGLDFQIDLLMNFSDDIYDMLFRGLKGKSKEDQVKALEEIHKAWAEGDMNKIEELNSDEEEISEKDMPVYEEYANKFMYDRNKVMAAAAEEFIDGDKNVFFVVGAAHYTTEKGIIAILEKDGYKVERIEY